MAQMNILRYDWITSNLVVSVARPRTHVIPLAIGLQIKNFINRLHRQTASFALLATATAG